MASPFGVSFMPGSQPDNGNGQNGRTGAPKAPLQEAVKILSLRLPKFYGAGSIAPAPLLTSPGGMGQPGARGNVTAQALSQLAGLPPSMLPTNPAPLIPSGMGGTETTAGWNRHEGGMNGRGGAFSSILAPRVSPIDGDMPVGPSGPVIPGGQPGWEPAPAPGPVWPTPEPPTNDFPPVTIPGYEPPPGEGRFGDASGLSPWEAPGRNEALARKYLDEIFGSY